MPGPQNSSVANELIRLCLSSCPGFLVPGALATIEAPHRDCDLKYLMWLLKAAIFFVLFAFALNNQEAVTLHWFFGASSQAPMVLVLLLTLLLGVILGVAVMLPLWWRARHARARPTVPTPASPAQDVATPTPVILPAPDIEPPAAARPTTHGL